MASSTRRSLAGQAASAARKVIGRRSTKAAPAALSSAAPAKTKAVKVTPAKKAPAKPAVKVAVKAPAKKAPAKKAPATKAPAVKAPAKKAPATKAPAKKAPAKKAPAKKVAATKAPVTKPVAKKAPVKKAPVKKAPATKAPAKQSVPAKKPIPATKKAASVTSSAPAKKPAAAKKKPSLVVKQGEGAWTKAELKEVLDELNEQRAHSSEIIENQEAELSGLMRDSGDGAGHDQADMGATSFERDHELTVLGNERDKLAQIDRALARIEDGTYGVCEACSNPIGKMRVMAFPRATLCLTCKQREERR